MQYRFYYGTLLLFYEITLYNIKVWLQMKMMYKINRNVVAVSQIDCNWIIIGFGWWQQHRTKIVQKRNEKKKKKNLFTLQHIISSLVYNELLWYFPFHKMPSLEVFLYIVNRLKCMLVGFFSYSLFLVWYWALHIAFDDIQCDCGFSVRHTKPPFFTPNDFTIFTRHAIKNIKKHLHWALNNESLKNSIFLQNQIKWNGDVGDEMKWREK